MARFLRDPGRVHGRVYGRVHGRVYGGVCGRVHGGLHSRVYGRSYGRVHGRFYARVHGRVHGRVYGRVHSVVHGRCSTVITPPLALPKSTCSPQNEVYVNLLCSEQEDRARIPLSSGTHPSTFGVNPISQLD